MEEVKIKINGLDKPIKALKQELTLYQEVEVKPYLHNGQPKIILPKCQKTKYIFKFEEELYKKIPLIAEIGKKNFYKTDITEPNQKEFALIEC